MRSLGWETEKRERKGRRKARKRKERNGNDMKKDVETQNEHS